MRLTICSAAQNVGSNAANGEMTDVAGNPRIFNSETIDLGAYELQAAEELLTWFIDADEDGYGASSTTACERPTDGFLASELSGTTNDCDDSDLGIHPGASEICNGIDDDCDTQADNVQTVATTTDDMIWTGMVDTSWHNECNWSPIGVPTTTNRVLINSNTSPIPDHQPHITIAAVAHSVLVGTYSSGGSSPVRATLTIESDGILAIDSSYDYRSNPSLPTQLEAIRNNGNIINRGQLLIGTNQPFGQHGIGNLSGTVINHDGAEIRIANYTGHGVRFGNEFDNHGTLIIESPLETFSQVIPGFGPFFSNLGAAFLHQYGHLRNFPCGEIYIRDNSFGSFSIAEVTNQGLMIIDDFLSNNDSNGPFTNNGILTFNELTGNDDFDNDIINANDSSVIIRHDTLPIFDFGGNYNGTIEGIYTDEAASMSAGTFIPPNTFTPLGLSSGMNSLYAKITPQGNACTHIVPFNFSPDIQLIGNGVHIPSIDTILTQSALSLIHI